STAALKCLAFPAAGSSPKFRSSGGPSAPGLGRGRGLQSRREAPGQRLRVWDVTPRLLLRCNPCQNRLSSPSGSWRVERPSPPFVRLLEKIGGGAHRRRGGGAFMSRAVPLLRGGDRKEFAGFHGAILEATNRRRPAGRLYPRQQVNHPV